MRLLPAPGDYTRAVIRTAAHMFDAPLALVLSRSKAKRIAEARAVSIGILLHADSSSWTLGRLGVVFSRDHTTVHYNRQLYRGWCNSLGLGWEAHDVAGHAEAIARYLGYDPLPLTTPYLRRLQTLSVEPIDGENGSSLQAIAKTDNALEVVAQTVPTELPTDPRLARFVQIYLVADPSGSVDVPVLGAFYRDYCSSRGETAMPLAQFGAALLRMVRADGGRRCGPHLTGLALRHQGGLILRTPPPVTLLPEPTLPARWIRVDGRPPGGALVTIDDDGSMSRSPRAASA